MCYNEYMQKEIQTKITRLLSELNELDKGPICLTDLAPQLGVSVRTLQRDMRDIQEADFPLYCPEPGSYAFMEGFSLEKIKLSHREACMLVVMSEIAHSLGNHFGGSFDLLKKRLLGEAEENPFYVKFTGGEEYPDTPITREISACILAREKMVVCYDGGRRACYPVRPLKLIWVDGFWYLLSLTDYNKLLKFRLEKITSAKGKGTFFKYDENIEKILRQSINIWFEQERNLEVELEISAKVAKYFKARSYFPLQKIKEELPDGRLILACRASSIEEIIHTIFHWLPEIKVISPKELASEVKQQIKTYLKEI